MAAYISKKNSRIKFFISFSIAAGIAAGGFFFLKGPRLGPYYDYLMNYTSPPPLAREILLIETGGQGGAEDLIEPAAAASVLMTLAEMDAGAAIIQVPVLGVSSGGTENAEELVFRFDEEFGLLGRNIRNLFEAIRLGLIAPEELGRYVGDLVNLTDRGKERLLSDLVYKNASGTELLERASAVFGKTRIPGDLRVRVIGTPQDNAGSPAESSVPEDLPLYPNGAGGYSKPRPDPDGRLRRIAPVLVTERESTGHIVYTALKETALKEGKSPALPLDDRGAALFKIPRENGDFRRIALAAFSEYEEADRELYRVLREAEALGIYDMLEGEAHPAARYEYALALREDLLDDPGGEKKARWIDARGEYFQSLDDFFYGPTEMSLVSAYEELIASQASDPSLGDEEVRRLTGLRDELIRTFVYIRGKYTETAEKREGLKEALAGSFCILGPTPVSPYGGTGGNPSDSEASALLANSILTGSAVKTGEDRYILGASLLAALLAVFCLRRGGPGFSLGMGLLLTGLIWAGFSYSFILTSYWIDPMIPSAAAAAGVFSSFLCSLGMKRSAAARFRRAYGPYIAGPYLRRVIRAGKPLPGERTSAKAAIVAVRHEELPAMESRGLPLASADAIGAFRETAARIFKKAGGTVVGCDGDLILIAFGSPLERTAMARMKAETPYEDDIRARFPHNPVIKAAGFVSGLVSDTPESRSWRFGIDTGPCAFSYSPVSGYGAFGHPVIRARILSSLASRYKARVLVSSTAREKMEGLLVRKLAVLVQQHSQEREVFYELLVKPGV
jgi:class 3 adenylate cyclase